MTNTSVTPNTNDTEQLAPTSFNAKPLLMLALCIALFVWLYRRTFLDMWSIWGDSDTYAHGYVVFPAVAWLIWSKRKQIIAAPAGFSWWGLAILFACGMGWVFATLLSVGVVAQFLLVTMLLALIWAGIGTARANVILFPLLFAYFAVPMGEGLVPLLMEFTADFAVAAISLTGIPIYREGMFFSIPAGDFEVAVACSGIRYLMASFSLGTLYAYLTLSSRWQQFAFAGLAIVVPIIANGFRAYMVVMIAHHTDMQHAVGADHLVYGWLFFGVVMFILFYIGSRFSSANQPDEKLNNADHNSAADSAKRNILETKLAAHWPWLLLLPIVFVTPHLVSHQVKASAAQNVPSLSVPQGGGEFSKSTSAPARLNIAEFDHFVSSGSAHYRHRDYSVGVNLFGYIPFDQDAEMVNNTNLLVDPSTSNVYSRRIVQAESAGGNYPVVEVAFRKNGRDYLGWYWYQFNDAPQASQVRAKIQEGKSWVFGRFDLDEAIVVVLVEGRDDEARQRMQKFYRQLGTPLRECLFAATSQKCHEVGVAVEDIARESAVVE